jgi:(p)ppGpp synthase/HD superfamily hydrolase
LNLVLAGLLHDTVEDTPYTLNQIAMKYGEQVGSLVAEVSNLYNREARKLKFKKREKFANMLKNSGRGSMTVKLFDRLDNMRTIEGLSEAKRAIIAQETMDFFVPMAKVLGYKEVEEELIACGKPYLTS